MPEHEQKPEPEQKKEAKHRPEHEHKKHHKIEAPPEPKHIHHVHGTHRKGLFSKYIEAWKEVRTFTYLWIVGFDLAFYVLLYLLFYVYGVLVNRLVEPLKGLDPNTLVSQSTEQLAIYQQSVSSLVFFVMVYSIIFSLLFILIWSLSRGLIWSKLLDKKASFKYFGKFYLLNLVWFLACAILSIILGLALYAVGAAGTAATIIASLITALLAVIMVYLMYLLYYRYTETGLIWRSYKEAVVLGFRKCPRLAMPVIAILLTVLVFALVSYPLKYLPELLMNIISYILFFGVFGWVKMYSVKVLKERT